MQGSRVMMVAELNNGPNPYAEKVSELKNTALVMFDGSGNRARDMVYMVAGSTNTRNHTRLLAISDGTSWDHPDQELCAVVGHLHIDRDTTNTLKRNAGLT